MVDRARTIGAWVETHVISQIERHVGVIVLVGMLVLTGLGGEIWSLVMENRSIESQLAETSRASAQQRVVTVGQRCALTDHIRKVLQSQDPMVAAWFIGS